MVVVKDFFKSGRMLKEINSARIVLISKVNNNKSLDQFRPVALCNFVYKVITKILENILKHVISDLISIPHTAFLKEISIGENIILTREMLGKIYTNRRSKDLCLKVDICIAFDKVRWSFILSTLAKMNFSDSWIG